MPHLDSEVADFADAVFFCLIDFVAAHWQLPIHPSFWHLCGIVTPTKVVVANPVVQGLINATPFFKVRLNLCLPNYVTT